MTALIFPEKVRLDFIMLQQKPVLWTPSAEEPGQAGLTPGGFAGFSLMTCMWRGTFYQVFTEIVPKTCVTALACFCCVDIKAAL